MATVNFEGKVRVPADVFDLSGFRRWAHSADFPDRGRIAFLDGDIEVDMSPEELETHNRVKTLLTARLSTWIEERELGDVWSDGVLLVNEAAGLATEPDLMFCSAEGLRTGRVAYAAHGRRQQRLVEVRGAPDIVVEIVSQRSVRKDTRLLPPKYFAAGILEYWLVDARGATIDFRLGCRAERGYAAVQPGAGGYRPSAVLQRDVLLTKQPRRGGGWRYDLLLR